MTPSFAEHLDHEVRAAIQDPRDIKKRGASLDKAAQPDHTRHFRKITLAGGAELRDQIDPAEFCCGLSGFEIKVLTDHAANSAGGVDRDLARDMYERAGADEGNVVGDGRHRFGERYAERGQANVGRSHAATDSPTARAIKDEGPDLSARAFHELRYWHYQRAAWIRSTSAVTRSLIGEADSLSEAATVSAILFISAT